MSRITLLFSNDKEGKEKESEESKRKGKKRRRSLYLSQPHARPSLLREADEHPQLCTELLLLPRKVDLSKCRAAPLYFEPLETPASIIAFVWCRSEGLNRYIAKVKLGLGLGLVSNPNPRKNNPNHEVAII